MQIRKIIYRLLICIMCIFCLHTVCFAAGNVPFGDIGEYGNWINENNVSQFNENLSGDVNSFQKQFQTNLSSSNFVPIEVKIGLAFMKALSSVDYILQISLVRFAIVFLFIMYAFWIALESYKMIRESTDYKTVIYDVFKKGLTIAVWVIVLRYGPAKIFNLIINPVIALGTYLSDFILNAVAQTYNVTIPDTCATIHQYVDANNTGKLLIDADTSANIMCLPGRISVYFYHAVGSAWDWIVYGLKHVNLVTVIMGIVCGFIFIKCIFKYAFMTLGIVADLFLKLLMLPFTALAESMPSTSEKNYVGQIFNGVLKLFNTQKLSDIFAAFINTAIYFVSLAIIIAICGALLTNIVSISSNNEYAVGSAMTTILCGCLVLYLTGKSEDLAKKVGGSVDNTFGEQSKKDIKTVWNDAKGFGTKIFKAWIKSK